MKKLLLLLTFFFAFTVLAEAQFSTPIQSGPTPIGIHCTPNPQLTPFFVRTSDWQTFVCTALDTWTPTSGGGGGGGISTINGSGIAAQIIQGTAVGGPNVSSVAGVTTISNPSAGAATAGIVTAGTQIIDGAKTLTGATTVTNATVNSLNVGPTGATNPAFSVDSSPTVGFGLGGIQVIGGTNGSNPTIQVVSPLSPTGLNINTLGASGITFQVNGVNTFTVGPAAISTHGSMTMFAPNASILMQGSTSGSSTIIPQAIAGNYTFQLPNANPAVGQNVYVAGFSAGIVTLGYQNSGGVTASPYDLGAEWDAIPTASQEMLHFVANRSFTLAVTGSTCHSNFAATAQADFVVQYCPSGVSCISKGTLRFAATGVFCSVVSPVSVTVSSGDVVKIIAPASPDGTLSNVTFTLKGTVP